jgi:hypothetical protein
MIENPAGKLFKEPAIWPQIPPWWLISSTDAAALLNVKPATLHSWRIRGQGPKPYPPMYFRPTQGRPLYYQYGSLRTWAASRLGMAYPFDDQCMDFFREALPLLVGGTGGISGRIAFFEKQFLEERQTALRGKGSCIFELEKIHDLDVYYSRQPKLLGPKYIPSQLDTLAVVE